MHVDKVARTTASQLFRDFITGKISNDNFEDQRPVTSDNAIDAIWDTAWLFYSDLEEHRLKGRHKLPTEQKRACIRWLLFLHSDFNYEWPDIHLPGYDPATRIETSVWKRIFSSDNTLDNNEATQFLSSGHYAVWPFISVADYKSALANPRFLSRSTLSIA